MEQILSLIRTTKEADQLSQEFTEMLSELFSINASMDSCLLIINDPQMRNTLGLSITQEKIEKTDIQALRAFLIKLQEQLTTLLTHNTINLTIAFHPDDDTLTYLYQHVKEIFGKQLLLEIHYDPLVVAGARVEMNGRYKDYSLGSEIDKLFTDKKMEIEKLLK